MKTNRHHTQIIEHIKQVLGIDISAQSQPIRRQMINVDVSNLHPNKVADIYRAASQYKKISVEIGGYKKLSVGLI